MKRCLVCNIALVLAGIGALNWGLVALANFNLVSSVLGEGGAAKAVYALVGLSGLLVFAQVLNLCPCTKAGCASK